MSGPDTRLMRTFRALTAVAAVFLLCGSSPAADLRGRIAKYDYRNDRREMTELLARRQAVAVVTRQLVAAFRREAPMEGVPGRLSAGPTYASTRIAQTPIGGDRLSEKARERAAFEARAPRVNDAAIAMAAPDPFQALTAPLERIAASFADTYSVYPRPYEHGYYRGY